MSLPDKYRIDPRAPIHKMREKRHRDGRDFKVVITSRDSTTGTGKTTLAIWLAMNWQDDWSADQGTLHVNEFLDIYTEQEPGNVLLMDEAEQVDSRRAMSNKNVNFAEKWMMMRYSQVDSILTLPTATALDNRLRELSDIWINVIERGMAKVHNVKVGDYDKKVNTFPIHSLTWPDISNLDPAKEMAQKKHDKIQGELYQDDEDDKPRAETDRRVNTIDRDAFIKAAVDKWGVTQRDVAEQIGMKQPSVSRIVNSDD